MGHLKSIAPGHEAIKVGVQPSQGIEIPETHHQNSRQWKHLWDSGLGGAALLTGAGGGMEVGCRAAQFNSENLGLWLKL